MKRLFTTLLLLCCMACQKKIAGIPQQNPLIVQAQNFFTGVLAQKLPQNSANFRANQVRTPDWHQAEVKTLSMGQVVEVPIQFEKKLYIATALAPFYLDINQLTKLVLYRDSSGFHYQVLTFIPDSNAIESGAAFAGYLLSEDWSGNSLASPERIGQPLMALGTSSKPVMDDATVITVCTEIEGYNYSPADPDDGYAWSESTCMAYSIEANSDGGDSGLSGADASVLGDGAGGAAAVNFQIAPPDTHIASVAAYFNCFTNVGGSDHTYTVTLAVQQPVPGTRDAWIFTSGGPAGSTQASNIINTGHTFLIFTESYGNTTITRNIGFYPSTFVGPTSPSSLGEFSDDENHQYNISGSFAVNNAQFYDMLDFIISANNSSYLYNLNTNNCSTFAINTFAQAGINLPRTIGSWPGGSGCDPGDLGEDILVGNIPTMTVNASAPVNHSNVGQCN